MTKDLSDGFEDNSVHEGCEPQFRRKALYYSCDSQLRRFRPAPLTAQAWGFVPVRAPLPSPATATLGPQTPHSSKEFDLLSACAAVSLAPDRIAYIAGASELGVDWRQFLHLAEHHGVLALVARNLGAHAPGLPTEIEQELRSAFEQNVRRNLWFTGELGRIAVYLNKRNLRAIPYKGPALAESAYGDLALRIFSDLDFLISPADFDRAKLALAELGYRPAEELTPAVERFWLRRGYERAFDGAAGKNLLELQWNVLPYFYAVDLATDDLLARSGQTSVGGRDLSCLSPEDSLLVLCLHAAKHLWTRLIWVCDIAETVRTQTIDYPLVLSRARSLGILRIVGVSFWLAEHFFGLNLLAPARQVIINDPEVPVLGLEFAARLAASATYDLNTSEYFQLILRLRERRADRWRYLWRLIWTPGAGDLAALQLPEAFFPLYRVVRLARLVRKLV